MFSVVMVLVNLLHIVALDSLKDKIVDAHRDVLIFSYICIHLTLQTEWIIGWTPSILCWLIHLTFPKRPHMVAP